jgi:hypothetical protein
MRTILKNRMMLCALAALAFRLTCGCGGSGGGTMPPPLQVAMPSFSPAGGTFASTQTVTLSVTAPGATIHYTIDGTTPTASSATYTSALTVSSSQTLKAIAVAGGQNSPVAAAFYAIAASPVTPSYTWKNVQIVAGGFITGIVFHPAQQNLVYVRTDIGSSYRWDNVNQMWIPLTDWLNKAQWNYTGTESIAVDPSDPTRLYIAAGLYTDSWNNNNGAILLSTDQGNTFTVVPLAIKMGSNDNGRNAGERLAVDPNLGSILYFGSRLNGLWKSTDSGAHWAQVTSFPVTGSTTGNKGDGVGVVFVNFVQSSGTAGKATPTIYVGVSDTGDETTNPVFGLYRSTNDGNTWTPVPNQPTGMYPNHGVFGPDGNLYISYGNDIGPNGMTAGAIWKYNPSTATWANLTTNIIASFPNQAGFGAVAVDQLHPGTIMVTTLDRWGPHDDIYRSVDGGNAWTALRTQATDNTTRAPYMSILQTTPLGWWMAALAIDPFNSDHVLYGTGATIWASTNATQTATNWAIGALGVEETAVLQLISPPSGANLVSGVADICGFVHTDLTVSPPEGMMQNPVFTTTSGLDFAQSNPSIMARVGHNGHAGPYGAYSTNGGTHWTPFSSEPAGVTTTGAGSIGVSADGTTFVWAPGDSAAGVSYTKNNGGIWTASTGVPSGLHPVIVADRGNAQEFYFFDPSNNSLYASIDGGATFSVKNSSLPNSGQLSASYAGEGDLWLASGNGLFHSVDSGATFTQVTGTPAVQQAYAVGFGEAAASLTYPALYLFGHLGGMDGFFRSVDGGATWVQMNDSTHQYGNAENLIIGDPRVFGRVYIGTNGRGIIYGDSPH